MPAAVPPSKAVKNLNGAVETLNRKMNVSIDEHTPALWDTGTMDFSESVEQLQIRDGRFMLLIAALILVLRKPRWLASTNAVRK